MRILYSLLGAALFVGALMFNVSSATSTTEDQFSSALALVELEENVVLGQTESGGCDDPSGFCPSGSQPNKQKVRRRYNIGGGMFMWTDCCTPSYGSTCDSRNTCPT